MVMLVVHHKPDTMENNRGGARIYMKVTEIGNGDQWCLCGI